MSTARETASIKAQGVVPNADEAWVAVVRRDRAYDGAFVYAVKTTGVYCRPSCPSRRARRENVDFYADAASARQHGFRACQRCRPDEETTSAETMVARARAFLERHVDEPVTLDQVARAAGVSSFHLQRTFTRELGVSPKRYHTALRAARFRSALRRGAQVLDAAFEAGFGASSRAYEAAPGYFGMTPALYRRGAPGVNIRFTTRDTALGVLLVAATERGVCAVFMGDSRATVERLLAEEYPKANRTHTASRGRTAFDTQIERWADEVARSVEAPKSEADVPIDVAGTPFQQRVWQTLRGIPPGETRSYAAVARAVGSPGAVRAVANACASNRVAVLVPCHRVVRENGEIGGYRWGHERKQRLLTLESRPDARRRRDS